MNRFKLIGHPIVVFLLICAFVFVYFVYLKGGNPLSFSLGTLAGKPETEMEQNIEQQQNIEPQQNIERQQNIEPQQETEINGAPLAVPGGPLQDPLNQQNPVDQPNKFASQQNQRGFLPMNQGAAPAVAPNPNAPVQPIAVPDMTLQEGHWIGLEVIPLTAALAKANSVPPDVVGVLIDEVTLLAAEAGLVAGDVITAVNDKKVMDLKSFWQATKDVGQSNRASVGLYRGGKNQNIVIFSTEALGMAQMEAAPMILATDKSPHGYYGPCDKCHSISKTPLNAGQLAKDQGDVLTRVAPTIRKGTPPPHRKRGTCTVCHVVL